MRPAMTRKITLKSAMYGALLATAVIGVAFIAVSWLSVTIAASPSCILYRSDEVQKDLSPDLTKRLALLGIAVQPGPEVVHASNEKTDVVYERDPLYLSICTMDDTTRDWLGTAAALQPLFDPSGKVSLLLRPDSRWVREGENGQVSLPVPADFGKIAAFMDCVKERGMNACRGILE